MTSATEELRRLLDERGVEHYDGTEEPMVSPGETFTLGEMQELYDEVREKAYNTYVLIDGANYSTDWGYGLDGIMYFLEMLKHRHSERESSRIRR